MWLSKWTDDVIEKKSTVWKVWNIRERRFGRRGEQKDKDGEFVLGYTDF